MATTKAYEAHWAPLQKPTWRKFTSLPLMAIRGLLDHVSETKTTWDQLLVGWDLASFASYRHNVDKSVDLDEISSLDPKYRLGTEFKAL